MSMDEYSKEMPRIDGEFEGFIRDLTEKHSKIIERGDKVYKGLGTKDIETLLSQEMQDWYSLFFNKYIGNRPVDYGELNQDEREKLLDVAYALVRVYMHLGGE